MMLARGKSRSAGTPVKIAELTPGGSSKASDASQPGSTYRIEGRIAAIAADDAVAIAVALNKRFHPRTTQAAPGSLLIAGCRLGRPPLRRIAFYAALIAAWGIVALNFEPEAFVEYKVQINAAAQPGSAQTPQRNATLVHRVKEGLRAVTIAVCRIALPPGPREGPTATAGIRN